MLVFSTCTIKRKTNGLFIFLHRQTGPWVSHQPFQDDWKINAEIFRNLFLSEGRTPPCNDFQLNLTEFAESHLFHLAELVHMFLVLPHAVLRQVEVGRVLAQLLLILWCLLQHLAKVPDVCLLAGVHPLALSKLLQLLGHLPGEWRKDGDLSKDIDLGLITN